MTCNCKCHFDLELVSEPAQEESKSVINPCNWTVTATERFIEDAIKGGWDNKMQTALDWVANGMYREPLLEPPAWQAVGKTRGWVSPWRYYWIQFIDHLADGKTIDEALQAIE